LQDFNPGFVGSGSSAAVTRPETTRPYFCTTSVSRPTVTRLRTPAKMPSWASAFDQLECCSAVRRALNLPKDARMVNLTESSEQKVNGEKARGQIEGMEQRH
jgi:hypothetical protein